MHKDLDQRAPRPTETLEVIYNCSHSGLPTNNSGKNPVCPAVGRRGNQLLRARARLRRVNLLVAGPIAVLSFDLRPGRLRGTKWSGPRSRGRERRNGALGIRGPGAFVTELRRCGELI